jgi:hypothetical protein
MIRVGLVVLAMLALPGFIFFVTVLAPTAILNQPHVSPTQPIAFDHQVHTAGDAAGIACDFCHRTNAIGMTAGYPEVQQCMFCHQVVSQSTRGAQGLDARAATDEIGKVREAWQKQQPINWVRVHRMPDHVRFVHEAHIQAGFQCATCHGDVGKMSTAVQVRQLGMGDCLTCHRQNNAPTECAICHK